MARSRQHAPSTSVQQRERQGRKTPTRSLHEQEQQGSATQLDLLIHERMRLGIVSALAVNESLSFNDLKRLLATSDGNLSVHARKLEQADYIKCSKFFAGRVPRTEYRLTANGRRALQHYLDHMEELIRRARRG